MSTAIKPMTAQQVFDAALFGIRGQGYRQSVNSVGSCMYRGDGGLKCGIGHALPEKIGAISVQSLDERDEYSIRAILLGHKASNSRPVPEIRLLFDGIEIEFLEAVQKAHDSMHYFYVSAWEPEMASIAKRHSLIYTPVGAA